MVGWIFRPIPMASRARRRILCQGRGRRTTTIPYCCPDSNCTSRVARLLIVDHIRQAVVGGWVWSQLSPIGAFCYESYGAVLDRGLSVPCPAPAPFAQAWRA